MKKVLSILTAVLLMVSVFSLTGVFAEVTPKPVPAGEKFYNAPYGKPVIDGTVDAIWDTAEWTVIDVPNSEDEVATGSQIKAKLLWDEEKLYFLAEIFDTDHNKDTDIFELYVDQKNDKTFSFKKDDSQTRFKLSGGVVQNSGTNCQNDAENACVQDGNNFTLEGAIVWTEGAPVAGQQMGLEFMYNDGGADAEFLAAFRWNVDMATAVALPFQCTRDWGYLNLMPAVVVPTLNGEPSAWAKEEIIKALEADLVPEHVNSAYTTDITRSDFCDLIAQLILKKTGMPDMSVVYSDLVINIANKNLAELAFNPKASFPDTDNLNVRVAAQLGIVNGRTNGNFDPNANITRQEAAKMLALAAKIIAASEAVNKISDTPTAQEIADWESKFVNDGFLQVDDVAFADGETIYAWAKPFVSYVNTIGVMNGTSTTTPPNFSPLRTYTREQSILTVYRLWGAL